MNNARHTSKSQTTNPATDLDDPFDTISMAIIATRGPGQDEAQEFNLGPLPEAFTIEPPTKDELDSE